MCDEAEKVINLSLCKMASSRVFKKGGSSLHKHLLIASVLTKARSAYFENWYLGDNDCSSPLNSTSAAGPSSGNVPRYSDEDSASPSHSEGAEEELSMNNNHIIDPRLFVEVESEIELPADILNCVEKLGSLGDMDFLQNNLSASNSSVRNDGVSDDSDEQTPEMILSDVMVAIDEDIAERSSTSTTEPMKLTYLDLDARPPTPNKSLSSSSNHFYSPNGLPPISSSSENVVIEPIILPGPSNHRTNFKRRRGWSSDGNEEVNEVDDDDDDLSQRLPQDLNEKLKKNCVSVTNMAKRLRISGSASSTTVTPTATTPSQHSNGQFRTKKPLFEIDEGDEGSEKSSDEDTDSFLGDSLGQASWSGDDKNDRRVPSNSASSSNSSSDEENEQSDSMEVDQITSLVQYFSFSKQKSLISSTISPSLSTGSTGSGLMRSISSPDLCNNLKNHRCVIVTT